jgi:hypothetical protein
MQFIVALALAVPGGGGLALAFDYRIDPSAAHRSEFRLAFASKSPLNAYAGAMDTLKAGVPREYASAMTWYRIALTSGSQPPLVAADWVYGDQLPEPLQWAWSAENGDLIARVGKGSFRLSFADSGNNWFRELDCRMVLWPGGDLQATMNCDDGTQRTMLIPEDGGVVVNDARYARAFKTEPLPPPEEGELPPDTDPGASE